MTAFDSYAASYDLLYADKDYAAETAFVLDRLRAEVPDLHSVLELGCGTGAHAALMAERGIAVRGIDLSATMLKRAEARRAAMPASVAARLSFGPGDVRTFRHDQQFDAIVSLFHVMSYQTTDDDLQSALRTAWHHLRPGGVFLFDFWYGPAVLRECPEVRVKRVSDDKLFVTRLAEPTLHHGRNLVEVAYHLFVERRDSGMVEQTRESHLLRYWFWPELQRHIAVAGFEAQGLLQWMTDAPVRADSWHAHVLCRKPSAASAA